MRCSRSRQGRDAARPTTDDKTAYECSPLLANTNSELSRDMHVLHRVSPIGAAARARASSTYSRELARE